MRNGGPNPCVEISEYRFLQAKSARCSNEQNNNACTKLPKFALKEQAIVPNPIFISYWVENFFFRTTLLLKWVFSNTCKCKIKTNWSYIWSWSCTPSLGLAKTNMLAHHSFEWLYIYLIQKYKTENFYNVGLRNRFSVWSLLVLSIWVQRIIPLLLELVGWM